MPAEPPPPYGQDASDGLLQNRRQSLHFRQVVEIYMLQKGLSGFNGKSIHPALDVSASDVKLDKTTHNWTRVDTRRVVELNEPVQGEQDADRHKWKDEETPEDVDLEALFQDVAKDQAEFKKALMDFEKNADPKYKIGLDLDKIYSIEDVIAAINNAKKVYDDKERKGFFAPIRKAFRKLGEHQDVAKSYLSLVPGQSPYFSLIYGGVTLLIEAAGRLHIISEEITDCISRIPTMIEHSQRALRVFSKSRPLQRLVPDLYTQVMKTLGCILNYYSQHAVPRALKVYASQSSFQKILSEEIIMCKQYSDAVDQETRSCSVEMGKETNQIVKKTSKVTERTYEKTGFIEEKVTTSVELLTTIRDFLLANPQLLNVFASPVSTPISTPQKRPSRSSTPQKARKTLVKRLNSNNDILKTDRRLNLEHGLTLPLADQDRAVYIMQSEILQSWLQTPKSSALLINGQRHGSNSLRTAVSFVSGKLADALHQARKSSQKRLISLHFFCAEHANWRDDPDNVPAGVMTSLLAQLLTQFRDFDLSDMKHLSTLDTDDIQQLLRVFKKLIGKLPRETMVFCIVDSVSVYEGDWADECDILLQTLIDIAHYRSARKGCVFKLLVTSQISLQSEAVEDLDPDCEILRLPDRMEKKGGFTDMKWDLGAGNDIADLADLSLSN